MTRYERLESAQRTLAYQAGAMIAAGKMDMAKTFFKLALEAEQKRLGLSVAEAAQEWGGV
jgi:hypothetical protein